MESQEQTHPTPPPLPKPDPRLRRAERTIRFGVYAGILYAALHTASVIVLQFVKVPPHLKEYGDPTRLIGLPLILIVVYFLYRKSRIAASLLFLAACTSTVVNILILRTDWVAIPFYLFFVILFGRATLATFRYRRLTGAEKTKTWKTYVAFAAGLSVILLILAAVTIAVLMETAILPSAILLEGDNIPTKYTTTLRDNGIIEPGENLIMFYSTGLFSILEDGNVLTSQRVISYWQEDGELLSYAIPINQIDQTIVVSEGTFWTDTEVHIFGKEQDDWFNLFLPAENDDDKRFLARLAKMRIGFEE